jgi:putative Mg2+ transporter-C (MgtC) family protein
MTTAIVLLATLLLNKYETRFLSFKRSGSLRISMVTQERPSSLDQITTVLEKARMKIEKVHVTDESADDGNRQLTMEFQVYAVSGKNINKIFEELWKIDGIRDIRMNWRE